MKVNPVEHVTVAFEFVHQMLIAMFAAATLYPIGMMLTVLTIDIVDSIVHHLNRNALFAAKCNVDFDYKHMVVVVVVDMLAVLDTGNLIGCADDYYDWFSVQMTLNLFFVFLLLFLFRKFRMHIEGNEEYFYMSIVISRVNGLQHMAGIDVH